MQQLVGINAARVASCGSLDDEWAVSPNPRATIKAHHPSTQPPSPLRNPPLGLKLMRIEADTSAVCAINRHLRNSDYFVKTHNCATTCLHRVSHADVESCLINSGRVLLSVLRMFHILCRRLRLFLPRLHNLGIVFFEAVEV